MKLPAQYQYLLSTDTPAMIQEAVKHYGLLEGSGTTNNPDLMNWSKELGLSKIYTADSIAWCGLFMAIVATRSGKILPFTTREALWARNWAKFGNKADIAMLGDVLVFERGATSGHVGLYVGEDANCYHVLAGNQGDKVSIVRILKSRCIAVRRPAYTIQPASVRVVTVQPAAAVSTNEA